MQIESRKGASACSRRNILFQKIRRVGEAARSRVLVDRVRIGFLNATGRIDGERRRAVYSTSESI